MKEKRYPPAYPHDPIEELFDGMFFVHGSKKIAPGLQIDRNMVVVRQGGELTLINPVRLSDEGLRSLDDLGVVRHVIRLGDFHGMDDPFYVDTYRATFWCQAGQGTFNLPVPSKVIEAGTLPPFNDAEFFLFESAKYPEAAILLRRHKLLITTDSVQYLTDWSYATPFAKLIMKLMGFRLGLLIGKPWLKRVTPQGGSMKADFDDLLKLDFDNIVSAHGSLLRGGAKEKLASVVAAVFSSKGSERASAVAS